nr:MAG TPA: hypothetical protein [Caudoviricetes sp.]
MPRFLMRNRPAVKPICDCCLTASKVFCELIV